MRGGLAIVRTIPFQMHRIKPDPIYAIYEYEYETPYDMTRRKAGCLPRMSENTMSCLIKLIKKGFGYFM